MAALERASLLDLQKLLKVQPIKAPVNDDAQLGSAASGRRGRFMPPAEAVANIRLDVSYVLLETKKHEEGKKKMPQSSLHFPFAFLKRMETDQIILFATHFMNANLKHTLTSIGLQSTKHL